MRKRMLLSGVLLSCIIFSTSQSLSFSDPLQLLQIEYSIRGYSGSTHYITPVLLTLKNNSSVNQQIKIANGQLLIPDNEEFQSLVVTKELIVDLFPKEKKTLPLHAMCIIADLSAPDESVSYSQGPESSDELKKLTRLIEESDSYSIEAQSAIWSLYGDRSLEQIVGFDTLLVEELTVLVAESLNLQLPDAPTHDDYSRNYYLSESHFSYKINGSFTYQLLRQSNILIAMFDERNMIVRELFRDDTCDPGNHNLEYSFDASHYTDEYYYVRLLENGRIMLELKVETPEELRHG